MLNLKLHNISNEFVNAAVRPSPLAIDLTNAFQKVMNERDRISDSVSDRTIRVVKYFLNTTVPELKAIVLKDVGMPLENVVLPKGMSFSYACVSHIVDKFNMTTNAIAARASGDPETAALYESYARYMKIPIPTYEELCKLQDALDKETRKLRYVKFGPHAPFSMILFFDIYSAFLMKDLSHEKVDYLTAQELAAIVLHEIGHLMSHVSLAANMWFVSEVTNHALDYFTKNAPVAERVKLMKAVLAKSDSKNKDLYIKAISKVEEATKEKDDFASGLSFGRFIGVTLWALSTILNTAILGAIVSSFEIFRNAVFIGLDSVRDYSVKASDFDKLDVKQLKYSEQLADEFAVKNGYGSYQITGLAKLYKCGLLAQASYLSGRKSSYLWSIIKFTELVMALGGPNFYGLDEHESPLNRQKSILKETCNVFKRTDMDPAMLNMYLEDYERSLQNMDRLDTASKALEFRDKVTDWLYYIVSIPMSTIAGAQYNAEYQKMFNLIDRLMASDLNYRAAKLDQLIMNRG